MARLHVDDESEESDGLPELLSVLNLTGNASKRKTSATTHSTRERAKITTTTAVRATEPVVSDAPKRYHKEGLPGAENSELRNITTGETVSPRSPATTAENSLIQENLQTYVSPACGTKEANRRHVSRFIAFAAEHESHGSEDDSLGSIVDFVVDDDYVSYESECEQENSHVLYEGRDRLDKAKTKRKELCETEGKLRIQSRRPLAPIPDNFIAPRNLQQAHVSPAERVQRRWSNSSSSEAENSDNGSEGASAGSLVDFVVDDDYVSYESEDEEENSHIPCERGGSHGDPEPDRRSLDGREGKSLRSPAIRVKNQWINDENFDSSEVDSEVSYGLGVNLNDTSAGNLNSCPPVYECPVLPSRNTTPSINLLSSPTRQESKLRSPRRQIRIPTPPHRPSEDTFWSPDFMNKWNDQHSPRKTPKANNSGRMSSGHGNHDGAISPNKSSLKTQHSKTREAVEAKKSFERNRDNIAQAFLQELDQKLGQGRVSELTACTGGVQIVWSKRLRTTGGRAYSQFKKDAWHAKIELCVKVVVNEERLINVMAHEYCHLANKLITRSKGKAHGKDFQDWGRKASRVFRDRGIKVTTLHSYSIDCAYVWQCSSCGIEYKRHSRSINPARQVCGKCRGTLIQIKPTPRATQHSGWQLYLKEHLKNFKRAHPGISNHEVMSRLGAAYREQQGRVVTNRTEAAAQPLQVLNKEVISLISDDEEDGVARDDEVEMVEIDTDNDDEQEDEEGEEGEEHQYPQDDGAEVVDDDEEDGAEVVEDETEEVNDDGKDEEEKADDSEDNDEDEGVEDSEDEENEVEDDILVASQPSSASRRYF